ncbi:MAG: beta-propeller fold lactonase family protein [Egibacteraceae bacterium]
MTALRPSTPGAVAVVVLLAFTGCSPRNSAEQAAETQTVKTQTQTQPAGAGSAPPAEPSPPAAPDVYAHGRPGALSPAVRAFPERVYVPNSQSNTVDVIDPATFAVVGHFPVGRLPQHVTPSWDLKTLWVNDNVGNSLTPIDPATGQPGQPIPVDAPYNLYFTPDGRFAIVVAERLARLDFRDPRTMQLQHSLPVPCRGVNHMDFSIDGRYLLASCEFSGHMVKVDVERKQVDGVLELQAGSKPQDVRLAPDGRAFYVADMNAGGLWLIDGDAVQVTGFVPTGRGAHGLHVSRDSRAVYVSNRDEGSISVVSFATQQVTATWRLPGGGSPDMGGVSADGRVLWLTGRYHGEVYAIDTRSGQLLARIKVGDGPHGLCVYPQPGRYSLGHNGLLR